MFSSSGCILVITRSVQVIVATTRFTPAVFAVTVVIITCNYFVFLNFEVNGWWWWSVSHNIMFQPSG